MNTKFIAKIGLLMAFGLILQLVAIPLPFFPEYLRYDGAEVPALIAAFSMGPWAGVLVEFGKNALSLLSGNAPSGIIGITANFMAGATFAYIAGAVYSFNKTKKMAVLGIFLGTVATTIVMTVANYFVLLPLWGVPKNAILPLLTVSIIPFNLIKGCLTGTLTLILYKKIKAYMEPEIYTEKKIYAER